MQKKWLIVAILMTDMTKTHRNSRLKYCTNGQKFTWTFLTDAALAYTMYTILL